MMTSLERIGATVQFQEPDRIPCVPLIGGASRRVCGVTYEEWAQDGELAAKCQIQAQELIGYDGIVAFLDLAVEAADFGQEVVYPMENTPGPNYNNPIIKTPDDYSKLVRFDPTRGHRTREVLRSAEILMNELGSSVPVMGLCYGPLGILEMLRSAEKLFIDCIKHKEAVIQGLEIVTDVLVDFIKAQAKTGVHAIILTTLFAANSIMSKKLWMETEGPFVRRLADTIRACGPMVAVHNCAEGPYFDAMIETMNPVILSVAHKAHGCKDWREVKQKWGSKVCLYGYMDPANILYLGTPDQVKKECQKEIEELGEGGGFILGPGCEFPPNASLLSAVAMMDGAKIYGQYKNTES